MTSCRMCEMQMFHGFLAQKRLFAEAPFSDQNQTCFDEVQHSSMHQSSAFPMAKPKKDQKDNRGIPTL